MTINGGYTSLAMCTDIFDTLMIKLDETMGTDLMKYFNDSVMNFEYAGLPTALLNELSSENYTADDIPTVVRLEVSDATIIASMTISTANIVNTGVGTAVEYLEGGLPAAMDALVSTAAQYTVSEYGGTNGQYAVNVYSLGEKMDSYVEIASEIKDLAKHAGKAQSVGLSLAQELLSYEMDYINANMSKALADIHNLDIGQASGTWIFAVHVDKYHKEENLRESGVRFYNYKIDNGVQSYVNYYNNIVYSKLEIIPIVNAVDYAYARAVDAVLKAEETPTRNSVFSAFILVEDLPFTFKKMDLQDRINKLKLIVDNQVLINGTTVVVIPDSNLESVVREMTGIISGDMIVSDLNGITSIDISSKGISNISGLEYMQNLTRVNLGRNNISSMEPLRNLSKLSYISIHNNQISDLSPLQELVNLQTLVLWSNQVSSLDPLSGLHGLTYLDVSRNNISDISAISELTNLQTLSIAYNNITSIEAVRYMVQLVHFYIGGNPIFDISPTNEYYDNILRKDF